MRPHRRLVLVAALALPLAGCDWFTDFKHQPKIDPWQAYGFDSVARFRGNPQFSVPMSGNPVPGYAVSYAALPGTIDSMAALPNPVPMSEASLRNGQMYYQINCAVCHGAGGAGNGSATRYGMVPISLLTPVTVGRSDGYIWGMIRNGRGLMPPYNRIEELDRWDVVNYVRALQGRAPAAADTTAPGVPGQTGAHLPGPTAIGPTRPAPHLPSREGTGAAPDTTRPSADTSAATDTSGARRNPGAQP
jgi:mono/diheme cytochrome c family protein